VPTYPTCPFCGKNDSKPSKEHLLPKWFAEEFGSDTWECFDELTNYTRKSTKHLHLVTGKGRRPCAKCNSGWLSRLEKRAKPILVPLMRGREATLTPRQQATIAMWFFARAVMFDLRCETVTPRPCYFDNSEFRLLHDRLTCDRHYLFFIAAYSETTKGFMREDQLFVNLIFDSDKPPSDPIRAYAFTLGIEHLILQIFCVKGMRDSMSYYMRNFDAFCKRLRTDTPITWPPERVFSPDIVNEFVFRWSRHLSPLVPDS
jgi:hypothetical protein